MSDLVIREFYGEEALKCFQLNVPSFHRVNADLTDLEKAIKFTLEKENKNLTEIAGNAKFLRVGAFLDDRLAASMQVQSSFANFDGHTVVQGVVGDVCSEPELRRGGGVRKVFMRIHELMRENGYVISHLSPFIANFYRKFGYEVANERVFWTIPTEYLPTFSNEGIRRYEGTDAQKADVKVVWEGWMKDVNLAHIRTDREWADWFNRHAPYSSDYYGYLHYDASGKPDGFYCYQTLFDGPQPMAVNCESGAFWYTTPGGLVGILSYAAGMKDYARELRICMPESAEITPVIEVTGGWGRKLITRRTVINGTTRFIDACQALELAAYKGSGKVCIELEDPTCPWNTGRWSVEFEEGKAISVKAGGEPDIRLTEKAFGPLLLGRGGLTRAEYHLGTVIYGNRDQLEKVFYRKTVFDQEH